MDPGLILDDTKGFGMITHHFPTSRGRSFDLLRGLAAAAMAAALTAGSAMAVDFTWSGGGGGDNWNTPGNWISGTAPTPGIANNVIFSGTTRLTPNQNLGTADFLSIQFGGTSTGNFTIGGNALRLGDYAATATVIVISNTVANASQTINNAIAFNETAPQISPASTGTITLGGLLTDGTGSATTTVILANGTLLPTNTSNSFSGNFAVRGNGTVVVSQMADGGSNSQIGAGSRITLGNGTADGTLRYTGSTVSSNRQFVFGSNTAGNAGAGTITANGSGPITFSNAAFNVAAGTTADVTRPVTLSGTNTGDNTISGAIIDNDTDAPIAITKSGSGTWVLSGNNTYSGTTNVTVGALVIGHANALGGSGAGTVVDNTASLGLQGSITTAEPITINGNGVTGNNGALYNVSGNNTVSGPVTLASTAGVGSTSGTLTLSNSVSGAFQLRKLGAGTVVLNGSNSYSGTTSVQGGTLVIGHANALGGTAVGTVVSNNMTLAIQGSITTVAEPVTISGTGVDGSGALVNLSGGNTLSGPVTLAAASTVGATSGTLTLSNAIGGAFDLTKAGAGTVVLGGANTYTGDTIVSAGVLRLNANQSTGGNSIIVSSGTFDANGFTMSMTSANLQGLTLGGGAAGSQASVTTSSGTIAFSSNQPQIKYIATNNPLGATISGNIQITSTNTATAFTIEDSTVANDDLTISAVIGGSLNNAYKASAGTLVLSGQNTFSAATIQVRDGTLILATNALTNQPGALGNNATDVNVGHLTSVGNASLLLRDGVLTNRGITIITNTSNPLGLSRAIGGANTSGTATLSGNVTVNTSVQFSAAAGGAVAFSGRIADGSVNFQSGATISKVGGGTVVLSGSNSTTLPWSVQAGTLLVNGTNAGAGGTTVDAGALLGGSGRINGLVTVSGTLSPGNSPGVITLSSLVLTSTATTLMEINDLVRGSQYDGINITSASGLTYGGILSLAFGLGGAVPDQTTFDLFNFSGTPTGDFTSVTSTGVYAGTWSQVSSGTWALESGGQTLTFSAATGDVVVVPEPGTLLLAICAAGFAAITARRRVKTA